MRKNIKNIFRTSLITLGLSSLGIISVFSIYAAPDSIIKSLAQDILTQIQQNADEFEAEGNDKNVYYDLVRADFLALSSEIDKGITSLKSGESTSSGVTSTGVTSTGSTTTTYSWLPVQGEMAACPTLVGLECTASTIGRVLPAVPQCKRYLPITCTAVTTPNTPTIPSSCGGANPSGAGVLRTEKGFGGIQDTEWRYVNNDGTFTGDNFGSTACKWTCAVGYTQSGNSCTKSTTTTPTNPKTITTDSSLSTPKSTYTLGEKMYGYVEGGDTTNTWGCMESPNAPTGCQDPNKNWRQLTKPYDGRADDWQYNPTTKRIELRNGFLIENSYPVGEYRKYVRTGTNGTPSILKITVKSAPTTTTYSWLPVQAAFGGCNALPACNAGNVGQVYSNSCAEKPYTCTAVSTTNPTPTTPIPSPAPRVVTTDSSLSTPKSTYALGEKMYAYVEGGDTTNTWACMEHPLAPTGCQGSANWRQLTKPYDGRVDDWQYNPTTKRIELRNGFLIENSYPVGEYRQYIRTGTNGTPSIQKINVKSGPTNGIKYEWISYEAVPPGCESMPQSCNVNDAGQVYQNNCGRYSCTAVYY